MTYIRSWLATALLCVATAAHGAESTRLIKAQHMPSGRITYDVPAERAYGLLHLICEMGERRQGVERCHSWIADLKREWADFGIWAERIALAMAHDREAVSEFALRYDALWQKTYQIEWLTFAVADGREHHGRVTE